MGNKIEKKKMNVRHFVMNFCDGNQQPSQSGDILEGSETTIERLSFESFLISIVIGDGCIVRLKNKPNSIQLSVKHGCKQAKYCEYKLQLLNDYKELPLVRLTTVEEKGGYIRGRLVKPSGVCYRFRSTTVNRTLRDVYNELYGTGVKKPTIRALNMLDKHGLAIWYMDQGSLGWVPSSGTKKIKNMSYNLTMSTCYDLETSQMVVKWMNEKYGLRWNVHPQGKTYILRLRSEDTDKFLDMVSPYAHSDIAYKFIRKSQVNRTSAERPEKDEDIVRPCEKSQEAEIKSFAPSEMMSNNSEFDCSGNCISAAWTNSWAELRVSEEKEIA